MSSRDEFTDIANYFNDAFARHGATARGLDWNGEETQRISLEQCSKILAPDETGFSLIDLGCGFGPYYAFLKARGYEADYVGYDLSRPMIETAKRIYANDPKARFEVGDRALEQADYAVASGIFNLRLDRSDADWLAFITDTIDHLAASARRGVAFNCLTRYSDPPKMRPDLYYADPCQLFDYCKRKHSRDVALLHDYGKYEFTILLRF
ncbi:MAG: class I SAM-dependent methyltransferase [Pseudomonadota bacterium]